MQQRSFLSRTIGAWATVAVLASTALFISGGTALSQQPNGDRSGTQKQVQLTILPTGSPGSDATGNAAAAQGLSPDEEFNLGLQIFMEARCYVCHGEQGFGGAGPRFREDRFLGLGDYVIGQILVGRSIMPSFANTLDDVQIAAVATYIRNAWGNQFGPVEPAQVASARQNMQLAQRSGARPNVPPTSEQPEGAPVPPYSPLPPGQPLPPPDLGQSKAANDAAPAPGQPAQAASSGASP